MQIPFILSDELVIENVRPIALRVADSSSARRPGHASRNLGDERAPLQGVFATTSIPVRLELAEGPISPRRQFKQFSRADLLVTREPTGYERSLCPSRLAVVLDQCGGQGLMHCNIIQLP